jgi:hypothetical protein
MDGFQIGHTIDTDVNAAKANLLVLSGTNATYRQSPAISALAVIFAYNEADILPQTVGRLTGQGVDVVVLDNWSTDSTYELATEIARQSEGRVRVGRFPEQPRKEHSLFEQLSHLEQISRDARDYDWILHHSADEWRMSPWPGVGLRDALAFVDALGFNAVDHTVLDFCYLANEPPGRSRIPAMERLTHFQFGTRSGHFLQIHVWKRRDAPDVSLARSGGHEVQFSARRVFPLKFLMRHYPLRSPEHARAKIFRDRLPRQQLEKAERGWNVHYDMLGVDRHVLEGWQRHELLPWSEPMFRQEFLVERLSGIGITGE